MRPTSSASSTSPHPRHVTSRLVSANSASADVNHSISPHVEQLRFAPVEPEPTRALPKRRSRRCFVCGTTGRHELDFRVCPRTYVLLRRSLAKIDENGRLVSFDGSPLPMTRHPGGVAAHIISRTSNPLRIVHTPRESRPPHPIPANPRQRVESPTPMFNSSSPHVIPHVVRVAPAPEHIPHRHLRPPIERAQPNSSDVESRVRLTWLILLLESLVDRVFRGQLRGIITLIERLGIPDPSTLRQHLQPVFERISLPLR
ncbi:hypothetical protein C8F04DRAFT_1142519 [Mycena alexandri]|uniref:Uncharacterized protein n=1 Tax=Mycena alexandri TaxID=1745969 RepID=A0AAD6S478_9AGAR|nr:hypothetical protein C8F04DRAFT_1142519 [Mycena alexandri]